MTDRVVTWPTKAPDSNLDYTLDLTAWAGSDTVNAASVTSITPTGTSLTVSSPNLSAAPLVTVMINGGTHGTRYAIEFLITSAAGLEDVVVALLPVVDPALVVADRVGANQVGG